MEANSVSLVEIHRARWFLSNSIRSVALLYLAFSMAGALAFRMPYRMRRGFYENDSCSKNWTPGNFFCGIGYRRGAG
jgi:hypothetical protein